MENKNIRYHIDSFRRLPENEIIIKGWTVSKDNKKVAIKLDIDENQYQIKMYNRSDIQRIVCKKHPYSFQEGFDITLSNYNKNTVKIIFQVDKEVIVKKVLLYIPIYERFLKFIYKYLAYVERISFTMLHLFWSTTKIPLFFYELGFIKTFIKIWNKLKKIISSVFNFRNKYGFINTNLDRWVKDKLPTTEELNFQKKYQFDNNVKISIVVPVYQTPIHLLKQMLESVLEQSYSNWELCIVDAGNSLKTKSILQEYSKKDKRIRVLFKSQNEGIAGNTNQGIAMCSGDYIGFLDHDDTLTLNCLFECVKVINDKKNQVDFIYTDEYSTYAHNDKVRLVHCKPDWSPDTLRSCNYICHFLLVKKDILNKVGGFRNNFEGSQDFDLLLRISEISTHIIHIPKILYNWKMLNTSVSNSRLSQCINSSILALNEHLDRKGLKGNVIVPYPNISHYKIEYNIIHTPKICIVIPNKNHIDDLKNCVFSIISKTTYPNFEILIVENNSNNPEIFDFYNEIQKQYSFIKVVIWKEKNFNYAAICNFGIKNVDSEYIILLNNDVKIITNNWIQEMLMYAQRGDVGIVGCRLLYPDNSIQHGGVILGIGEVASHVYSLHPEYFYRQNYVSNFSAVTAACLMVRKSDFEAVGGLDEKLFKVAYNDIDFCMKVRTQLNKLVVYTPFAELYHYESKSRGIDTLDDPRFISEQESFKNKWLKNNYQDPYYNVNLSLHANDFTLKELY